MKNILISTFIALIIGCLVGFFIGKNSVSVEEDSTDTFVAGWNSLKERAISSGLYSNNDELRSFSGKISEIKNGALTLDLTVIDPFWDVSLDKRVVSFDSNTKIVKFFKKADEVYNKEMEEALKNKDIIKPDSPDGLPDRFYSQDVDVSALEVGDAIIVEVDSNENLKFKKEFKVNKIVIKE